ncbi:hypothetical protein WUBG_04560 [Wuchereria bancrofti]|uniref:Uncharacterized protein n=1 Tax=Wuchereria bancrofti TaxID=6293 RepID=J9BBN3_WUCBA|nr:hypothetical protein WUBG_04560 [Wuchereria bancrofti]
MGKSEKKKFIPNVEKEEEDLNSVGNNCMTTVRNQKTKRENIKEEEEGGRERDKQNDNEIEEDETKLMEEVDNLLSMLINSCADNDNQQQIVENAKLHQENNSNSTTFTNHITISSDDKDMENFLYGEELEENNCKNEAICSEKVQEREVDGNNFKLNLIEIYDEAKDIDDSNVVNSSIITETTNIERSNLPDVYVVPMSKLQVVHKLEMDDVTNVQSTEISREQNSEISNIEILKEDFLIHENLDNLNEELAEKNKIWITLDSNIRIEVDIEVNGCTVDNEDDDTGNSILSERIEQPELHEGKEFETIADGINLPKSDTYITESEQKIDENFHLDDPVIPNDTVREKLTLVNNVTEEVCLAKIPEENNKRTDSNEPATIIICQQESVKNSRIVENLPTNESKVTCGIELLKDSEELNSCEVTQPKNKFYEAITGFWKHTAFSKKHSETAGQSKNLPSELTQISSIHSSKTSLTSTESLGSVILSAELNKSTESTTESTTKIIVNHSEDNINSSLLENAITDVISGSDQQKILLSDQSFNSTLTENLVSDIVPEALQVTPDSSDITDEMVKNSDDSFEKMEDSKKSKKGKAESTNLMIFGHKVC